MHLLLPRWLDDELDGREWAFGGVALLALATLLTLGWWAFGAPVEPAARSAGPVTAAVTPSAMESGTPERPALDTRGEPAALMSCPHQRLDLSWNDRPAQRACVATTRVVQDGGIRRYVFAPEGVSGGSFRLDTAGGQVFAAELAVPGDLAYTCTEDECHGITLGEPDRYGVRLITIHDAVLRGAEKRWRLNATLSIPPDSLDETTACTTASLRIVGHTGSLTELCPNAGAGFELSSDGRRRFTFDDNDGHQLVITLAPGDYVEQVELQGLSCTGPACSGVSTQTLSPASETGSARSFGFSGTVLSDGIPAGRRATLSGSLRMPMS